MKVSDIYKKLDEHFPFSSACDFDNVGLLVGNADGEVTRVVTSLDCTSDTVDFASRMGAELIVTHHPVIFSPLKRIESDSVVYKLITHGISVISAHTNFDIGIGGVNDCLCEKIGLQAVEVFSADGFEIRTGVLDTALSAYELAKKCKAALPAPRVRFTDGKKTVKRVAVCSGGGGSMLSAVMASGVDAYVTGEVKHSDFITAENSGFTLIECGHFETENIAVSPLADIIKRDFPLLKVEVFGKSAVNYI